VEEEAENEAAQVDGAEKADEAAKLLLEIPATTVENKEKGKGKSPRKGKNSKK
jgi:hypothetical protein